MASVNERATNALRAALRRKGFVAVDALVRSSLIGPKLGKPGEGCLVELHTVGDRFTVVDYKQTTREPGWSARREKFKGLHSAARRAVDLYAACRKR